MLITSSTNVHRELVCLFVCGISLCCPQITCPLYRYRYRYRYTAQKCGYGNDASPLISFFFVFVFVFVIHNQLHIQELVLFQSLDDISENIY